ncbi:MAG: glycosyltransferase family 4 protein [Pseudomonadota bacterium]
MKILFINPFFPPWVPGGAEHSLEQMCKHFAREDWDVEVLATAFDNRELDEQRSGYWVRWIQAPFKVDPGQNVETEDYFRTDHFYDTMLNRLKELDQPDVIIANNAQVYDIAGVVAGKLGVPIIGIVRDTQMLCEFGTCMDNRSAEEASPCHGYLGSALCAIKFHRVRGERGWRPIPAWAWAGIQMHKRRKKLRFVIRQFDQIVTISEALNLLVCNAMLDLKVNRVSTIRNFSTQVEPIDKSKVSQFLEHHGLIAGKFFIFAGRKTYGKGVDLLLNATMIAQDTTPACQCLLLGRGNFKGKIENGCKDIESVSQDLLLGLVEQSAALVIPGRWQEGLHRTMIDAIWLGVPVICTQAGAPPLDGVIDGYTGYVVPCEDSDAMASAMIKVLNWSEEKRESCREHSRKQYARNFETADLMGKWNEVLNKVIRSN